MILSVKVQNYNVEFTSILTNADKKSKKLTEYFEGNLSVKVYDMK